MTTSVYVGDTETQLILDCKTNISTASACSIEAQRPDGTEVSWPGSVHQTTKVLYVTQPSTFDQSGIWRLQAKVTIGTGMWRGESVSIRVMDRFG